MTVTLQVPIDTDFKVQKIVEMREFKLLCFIPVVIFDFIDICTCTAVALRSPLIRLLKLKSPWTKHPELAQIGTQLFQEKEYEKAIEFYDEAIKKNPDIDPTYYHGRGHTHLRTDNLYSAISDFKTATSAVEKAGKGTDQLHFNDVELKDLGTRLLVHGRMDDAYWCYTEAIKRQPLEPSYYRLRGNLQFQRGNLKETLSDYRQAVDVATSTGNGETSILEEKELVRLGEKLMDDEKPMGALWCYDQAIKRDPSNHWYYRLRGVCHEKLGNFDDALADYENGVQLHDHISNWFVLVSSLFHQGRYEEAIERIQVLNDTDIVDIALAFYHFNKPEDAIRLYTEAIKKNPKNVEAYDKRGHCQKKLHKLKEAMEDFTKVVELTQHPKPVQAGIGVMNLAKNYYGVKKGLAQLLR